MFLLRRPWSASVPKNEEWCRYSLVMPALPPVSFFLFCFLYLQDHFPGPAKKVQCLAEDPLIYLFAEHFYHEWLLRFIKWFSPASIEMIRSNGFSFFRLLICWITVINFWMSSQLWIGSPQTFPLLFSFSSPFLPLFFPSFFPSFFLFLFLLFLDFFFLDYFSGHLFSSSSCLIWKVLLRSHCFMHCGYIFLDIYCLIQSLFLLLCKVQFKDCA